MSDAKLEGDILLLFVLVRYKETQPCKEGRDGADQTCLGLESFLDLRSSGLLGILSVVNPKELRPSSMSGPGQGRPRPHGMKLKNKSFKYFPFPCAQLLFLSKILMFCRWLPSSRPSSTTDKRPHILTQQPAPAPTLAFLRQKSPRLQNLTGHLRPLGSSSRPQHRLPNILAFRAQVRTKIPFDICPGPSAKSFPL